MTYMLARWIFELPVEVFFSVIGTIVCYYIVGFEGNLGIYIITALLNYLAAVGIGSALAVIPLPLSVNCGFAAFAIVALFLGGDMILTPYQITRHYFLHGLEIIDPIRSALIIQIHTETDPSPFGAIILSQLGLTRSIDDLEVVWPLLCGQFVMFRIVALFAIWFVVYWELRQVRILQDTTSKSFPITQKQEQDPDPNINPMVVKAPEA